MTTRFSLLATNQQAVGRDQVAALDEQIALVHAIRDHGWEAVFAAQHHLSEGFAHIQPLPYLGRLAAETGDMKLGLSIHLLALHNPVDVAENFASLDIVTRGRLIFGVGLGYREVEYDAFGVPSNKKVTRFTENLRIVTELWSGEPVYADLPWCRLDGVRAALRPVQQPRPPIWMAANADAAVRRCARLADTWVINPHATFEVIERQLGLLAEERAAHALPPVAELPAIREVFCAPTRELAIERAQPYLAHKYEVYSDWGQDKVMPVEESFKMPYEELEQSRFVVGSPEDCIEQLLPWQNELGVDHFIFRTNWAGMPIEDALSSVDLLSTEVIPALRSHRRSRTRAGVHSQEGKS
jgi:alkanesulfonate monooxygenase SsuD/methylene tetrahydromethanopterin reductase-like flavin-dependent oxidoreductase (luciferase family)